MKKSSMAVIASLFSVLLLTPMALANVYVPPGPGNSMAAWITPTLTVIDTIDNMEVGWHYSDGVMYDSETQTVINKIPKELPQVPKTNKLTVEFSTTVVVFGWIPGVYVSPDQVPPPVELVITWNDIPYLVTLTLPNTQVVGWEYPPKLYPELPITYEFAFPAKTAAHYENAFYNIWYGDIDDVRDQLSFGLPKRDFPFGYYFWYKFHPNTGDWISFDCQPGKTMHPPTYDITALFEYSTSQIWFWHVAFDVRFLEVHKTILPNPIAPTPETKIVMDTISIRNIGRTAATNIDILQTFPSTHEVTVLPKFSTALAKLFDRDGNLKAGPTPLPNFGLAWPYIMPAPFDTLQPGEELIITMEIDIATAVGWAGTIVFDLEVSAAEIPPWKYPRSMEGLIVGQGETPAFLWVGLELIQIEGVWHFTLIPEWKVPTPLIRTPIAEVPPKMTLDPVPVDLNGDGKINGADVAMVRQAIVGLLSYRQEMDINVNGKVDTQDLAAYKLVAG